MVVAHNALGHDGVKEHYCVAGAHCQYSRNIAEYLPMKVNTEVVEPRLTTCFSEGSDVSSTSVIS
jgi:hypothetical protein